MSGATTDKDNPLLAPLGAIPSDEALLTALMDVPSLSDGFTRMHERPYVIEAVRALSVPDETVHSIARALDRMIRSSYHAREPARITTTRSLYSSYDAASAGQPQPRGAFIQGISGVGKTVGLQRALSRYPQCHTHETFPGFVNGLRQLVWLHVDVPATGKLKDLAEHLIDATVQTLGLESECADLLLRGRKSGSALFRSWVQLAKSHFLGILVLDEAQNIFRLSSVRQRKLSNPDHLRVAEDGLLKELLLFINSGQIPVVVAGTPDAEALLRRRISIAQRLTIYGSFRLEPFSGPDDHAFKEHYMPQLLRFQFGETPILSNTKELRELIFQGSAGIRRLIRMIWESAHAIAAEKQEDLDIPHIKQAIKVSLAHLQPAVRALISGDPSGLRQYEDLWRHG